MAENIIPETGLFDLSSKAGSFDSWARKKVFGHLDKITWGRITLIENDQVYEFGPKDCSNQPKAKVMIHHSRFYSSVVFGGAVGFGQGYMLGLWDCDCLTDLIRILTENASSLESFEGTFSWVRRLGEKLLHVMHRNSPIGSRKNIQAHYDLGNDFYSLWLDETMSYSSGIFISKNWTLEKAQEEKYDRLCRKLTLDKQDHVLEIGTGWGGFAEHAAQHYGCRITTTTISDQQYEYAKHRFEKKGLSGRITLLKKDYRDLEGHFDKLVSIEMIEAVGHRFIDTFFRCCNNLLKPEGMMALQAITIADQKFQLYKKEVDFIQRYIFPGGCLTSVTQMCKSMTRCTDMRLFHLEEFGDSYAKTLACWCETFKQNLDAVRALGFNECFIRMWEYYLCYCRGGFKQRNIGLVQMILTKEKCSPGSIKCVFENGND